MYYHGSLTPRQLKALKAAKAAEMRQLIDAMKLISAKYDKALTMLGRLRAFEIELSNAVNQGRLSPEEIAAAQRILERQRRRAAQVVDNFLSVK